MSVCFNVVFTICCNNYLAQAKVLARSIAEHSPNWKLFVILVDRKVSGINYNEFYNAQFIEVEDLAIANFQWMTQTYGIIELSTSVKADAFLFLHNANPNANVVYLDPDTCIYDSLDSILTELGDSSFGLTPHTLKPVPLDGKEPRENLFLNHGVFNLGFAVSKGDEYAKEILSWWAERLRVYSFIRLSDGYFTDQIWMNLAPIFFNGVKALRHPGFNVAYWNLHERFIEKRGGDFFVNEEFPLVFFHYSSVDRGGRGVAWRGTDRYDLESRPELQGLFHGYLAQINAYSTESIKNAKPFFEMQRLDLLDAERRRLPLIRRFLISCRQLLSRVTPMLVKDTLREIR